MTEPERIHGPFSVIQQLIRCMGDEPSRPGLRETPERVVASWGALFSGYTTDPKEILKQFEDESHNKYNQMVLLKDIEFYSTCEHHMLPFFGRAHVAYIPVGEKLVGISKLARLVECFSRRLTTQEWIGQQVTHTLDENLQTAGSACILEASHFCMQARGVSKQNSKLITSSLTGAFFENAAARAELFNMIGIRS